MSEVLAQSQEPPQPSLETISFLVSALDDLLERYLELLHNYQTLQQKLSKNLSSGFLSLAQANFSNQNRIRYGQDFYDERMEASLVVSINPPNATFSAPQPPSASHATPKTPSSPLSSEDPSMDDRERQSSISSLEKDTPFKPRNPLNWFGILVPPALRQAQESFRLAVEDSALTMATIATEMREVEIEVRRTRKKLEKLK